MALSKKKSPRKILMKLLNFEIGKFSYFGVVVENYAVTFEFLQQKTNRIFSDLDSIESYLDGLPQSFDSALALLQTASEMIGKNETSGMHLLSEVKILPPIQRPTALIDFGLTPRHLINSTKTMMKHEFGPMKGTIFAGLLAKRIEKSAKSDVLFYYKGNHLTVIGDHDEIGWPAYTSYLDIEPELAMVIGKGSHKIAGYTILNDASARDVQFPEMMGSGPARAKDFARGNGLGPFLVTPDEIPDPLSINVKIEIGNRFLWHGHTSEYAKRPEQVINFCETIFPLFPGTVLGLGTIPGCTGMDNDQWILPGEMIKMTFDGLGALCQRVPDRLPKLEKSRWAERSELKRFMSDFSKTD
jgi:2-keto-4-pentenoate hydratase/2-oxohepta-3-ene-1,7-dioic acid hydratase in catechol pathway